jgi:glyoxylase-like metal-dependent hydrolase (beta-lactamase superfamily II)
MLLRPFLNDAGSCASYLFGCTTHRKLAVVDAHVDLVDGYVEAAAAVGSPIVAVLETHVQADHVSGLPALVETRRRQRPVRNRLGHLRGLPGADGGAARRRPGVGTGGRRRGARRRAPAAAARAGAGAAAAVDLCAAGGDSGR